MKIVYKSRITKKNADVICAVYHFYSQHGKGPSCKELHEILGEDSDRVRAMLHVLCRSEILIKVMTSPIRFLPPELVIENPDSDIVISEENRLHLQAIKFLAQRDKCYPSVETLINHTNDYSVKVNSSINNLIRANCIIHQKEGVIINRLIPIDYSCEIIPDRYLISIAEAKVLCAIYHASHTLRRYPTFKELSRLTGYTADYSNRICNALKQNGIVRYVGVIPYGIEPVFHTPIIDIPESSRINEIEADILRIIYNSCNETGVSLDSTEITNILGINKAVFFQCVNNLIDLGILMTDIHSHPQTHYFLDGNGCDHVSYPPRSAFYKRIKIKEAEFLNDLTSIKKENTNIFLSSKMYRSLGHLYSRKEITSLLASLSKHQILTKLPGTHTYKINLNDAPAYNDSDEQVIEPKNRIEPKNLNTNQQNTMKQIQDHILRFGFSPNTRELSANYTVLLTKKYIYLDNKEKNNKIRVFHGVGFDDVAGDLPVETELTNSVYQTILDCISDNVAPFGDTREDVIAGRVRNNCFATVAEVAERSCLSESDMDKCLSVLRMLGKLRGSRDNRYQLSNKYITLA